MSVLKLEVVLSSGLESKQVSPMKLEYVPMLEWVSKVAGRLKLRVTSRGEKYSIFVPLSKLWELVWRDDVLECPGIFRGSAPDNGQIDQFYGPESSELLPNLRRDLCIFQIRSFIFSTLPVAYPHGK